MSVQPRVVEFAFLTHLDRALRLAELHHTFKVFGPTILLTLFVDHQLLLLPEVDDITLVIDHASLSVHIDLHRCFALR